jgi:uncharacterized protein YndB with AHSA1/START domain
MTVTDKGTQIELDGRPAVRFERTYPHGIDRVWRAVTDPDEMPHWFPSRVDYEPRVGAPVTFSGDPYAEEVTGSVLAWEPPRRFAFTWGEDEVHLSLDEVDGGCRFVLVDVLGDPEAAARNAAGWHVCLDQLAQSVSGTPGDGPHAETALPWQPLYDGYVAAGLPHGAALPME